MRILSILVMLFFTLLTDVSAQSKPSLERWVGKYPSDKIPLTGYDLWRTKQVSLWISDVLPIAERNVLAKLRVESRIEKHGSFLVINVCQPHDCSAELATAFIDTEGNRLWIAMARRDEKRLSVRWYSGKDPYTFIPVELQRLFTNRLGE